MNPRILPRAEVAFAAALTLLPIAIGQTLSEGPDLDAAKSLVVMIDGNIEGESTQGAGLVFAVEDSWSYIATAYHVVRKGDARATNLRVRFWQDQRETFAAEHYDLAKSEDDLAVLRVRSTKSDFAFKRLALPDRLKKAQLVYAIGHPKEEDLWNVTYLPGAISDIATMRIKVEAPSIKQGYSGGALIDERKMIVGMVLSTDGTTANILRIDRAVEILHRELNLTVQLDIATSSPIVSAVIAPEETVPRQGQRDTSDAELASIPRTRRITRFSAGPCAGGCNAVIGSLKFVRRYEYPHPTYSSLNCEEKVFKLPPDWPGGPYLHAVVCKGPNANRVPITIINFRLAASDRVKDEDVTILYDNVTGQGFFRSVDLQNWRVKIYGPSAIESMSIEMTPM